MKRRQLKRNKVGLFPEPRVQARYFLHRQSLRKRVLLALRTGGSYLFLGRDARFVSKFLKLALTRSRGIEWTGFSTETSSLYLNSLYRAGHPVAIIIPDLPELQYYAPDPLSREQQQFFEDYFLHHLRETYGSVLGSAVLGEQSQGSTRPLKFAASLTGLLFISPEERKGKEFKKLVKWFIDDPAKRVERRAKASKGRRDPGSAPSFVASF